MYHGEVNVAQEELNSFLAIAEDLKVKGLTQNKADDGVKKQTRTPIERQVPTKNTGISRQEAIPDQSNGQKSSIIQASSSYEADDDIQEVIPVKTEPTGQEQPHHIQIDDPGDQTQLLDHTLDNSLAMYEENYAEYGTYEEGGDAMLAADNNAGNRGKDPLFESYLSNISGKKCFQCHLSPVRMQNLYLCERQTGGSVVILYEIWKLKIL